MKKLFLFLAMVLCLPVIVFGAQKYIGVVPIDTSYSVLQGGTTAAFTVAVSSPSATAASYAVYTTSGAVVVTGDSTVKTWFIGLQKSTYTLAEFVNNINATTGSGTLSAAFSNGCYKLQVSSPQVQAEGTTNGLLTKEGGAMEYDILLSSINPVTVFMNATQYQSRYFAENSGEYNVVAIVSTGSAKTNEMYLYDGIVSSDTTTALIEPISDMFETFPAFAPVKSTRNYALEYRVVYSTWITTDDKIRIHFFTK